MGVELEGFESCFKLRDIFSGVILSMTFDKPFDKRINICMIYSE